MAAHARGVHDDDEGVQVSVCCGKARKASLLVFFYILLTGYM